MISPSDLDSTCSLNKSKFCPKWLLIGNCNEIRMVTSAAKDTLVKRSDIKQGSKYQYELIGYQDPNTMHSEAIEEFTDYKGFIDLDFSVIKFFLLIAPFCILKYSILLSLGSTLVIQPSPPSHASIHKYFQGSLNSFLHSFAGPKTVASS